MAADVVDWCAVAKHTSIEGVATYGSRDAGSVTFLSSCGELVVPGEVTSQSSDGSVSMMGFSKSLTGDLDELRARVRTTQITMTQRDAMWFTARWFSVTGSIVFALINVAKDALSMTALKRAKCILGLFTETIASSVSDGIVRFSHEEVLAAKKVGLCK